MELPLNAVLPGEIEARSMEIIQTELKERCGENALEKFAPEERPVLLRCIHTSADFAYYDNLTFSPNAVKKAIRVFSSGTVIVTDTTMALSGISKRALSKFGMEAYCFVADQNVAARAKEQGVTRSYAAVEEALSLARAGRRLIFAVGNAPTALVRIYELICEGRLSPALVIGVPVGFVNVVESKERILSLPDTPYIVAKGRKGGSNIAAAICNALLYEAGGR